MDFLKKNLSALIAVLVGGLNFAWFALPYFGIYAKLLGASIATEWNGYNALSLFENGGVAAVLSVFQILTLAAAALLAVAGICRILTAYVPALSTISNKLVTLLAVAYAAFAILALIFTIVTVNAPINWGNGISTGNGLSIAAGSIVNAIVAIAGAAGLWFVGKKA